MSEQDTESPQAPRESAEIFQLVQEWLENASAYELARMHARQKIGIYASSPRARLKPWNLDVPVTVVAGVPRITQEAHEAGQAYARRALSDLAAALRTPDAFPQFMRQHSDLAIAIFALKQEDRDALAQEYERTLECS